MAITTINNPNQKPWVGLSIPGNTETNVYLDKGGAYFGILLGSGSQSKLFTALCGDSGNPTATSYGDNTSTTIVAGSDGSSLIKITHTNNTARNLYIMPLNGKRDAQLTPFDE